MILACLDCSAFDTSSYTFPHPTSLVSSYCSTSTQESSTSSSSCLSNGRQKGGGLSRSRCVTNLSALGGSAAETSIPRQRHGSSKSGPNQHHHEWGYFVDTAGKWRGKQRFVAIAIAVYCVHEIQRENRRDSYVATVHPSLCMSVTIKYQSRKSSSKMCLNLLAVKDKLLHYC